MENPQSQKDELVLQFNTARIFLAEEEEEEEEARIVVSLLDVTDRKRAEEELHHRNQELSVLHTIDRAVNQTLDLDQVLNVAVEKTMEVLDAEAGGIYLLQEDGKTMLFVVHRGLSDEFVKNVETIQLGEGISGRAASERKPVIMDIAQYPSSRLAPFLVKEGLQSFVSIPLLAKDRVMGALNIGSRRPDAFPEDKIETLLSIGIQIGVAIQNAALFKSEQRKILQLHAINTISQNIAAFMDVEKLFSRVVNLLQETFGYSYVTLAVVDERTNEVVYAAAAGYDVAELKEPHQRPGGEGVIPWVASSGQSLLANDVSTEPHFQYCDVLKDTRSELAVPIVVRNKVVAILDIQSDKPNAFGPDDLTTFKTVAGDVGIAVENARLYEDLRGTTNYLQNLITYASAPIIVWSRERKITIFNRAFEKLSGYRSEEVIGRELEVLFPPADKQKILQIIQQTTLGERWESVEIPILRKDGEIRIALWNSANIYSEDGQTLVATIAQGQDITERKLIEERMRAQASLLDITSDAVIVEDLDDRILHWNRGAERLYGWMQEEVLGADGKKILDPADQEQFESTKRTVLEHGEWKGELRKLTKDGKNITVDSRRVLMKDEAGNPKSILIVNTDITEQKALEVQFLRSQRLESLGTLAGGIAHDLNNVLAPALLATDLLDKALEDEKDRATLGVLQSNILRGRDIIKQILGFARGIQGERTVLQLRHLLREIQQVLQQTLPKGIEIQIDTRQELWCVFGDATQLHQVLMNLCVNARDAMPRGGLLSIEAANWTIDEHYAHMRPEAKAGPYVRLKVSDTGQGMSRELLDKIFEPFFTTKETGKGTGLGLSTVHAIVKSHGGFIDADSKVGHGSTFTVYLPAQQEAQEVLTEAESVPTPRGHGEMILVVDDEPAIRNVTTRTLETQGYRVITAADGTEALALFAEKRHDIVVVLTDIVMPYLDGIQTIRALRKMNPQIKIIVMSGLSSDGRSVETSGEKVQAFLSKPFSAEILLKTLNSVLTQTGLER